MDKRLPIPSDPCWKESIFAIKSAVKFESFEKFKRYLIENLPQNSLKTKKRYASYVLARFFPNQSLEQLSTVVWNSYHDENILLDIMRFEFLRRERLISNFIENKLYGFAPGNLIPKEAFLQYLIEIYGENKPKVFSRLTEILRSLGYLGYNHRKYFIPSILPNKTSFLILLHYLFAKTVQTLALKDIEADPFWKYLRIPNGQSIRQILREASANNLISKYIVADQLDQITTKYSLKEFIERKMTL
ncbi:MAG: hypothetical protein QME90_05820 [Thermodesulfobacteriota bacterium]|nr:hypothetical protein [Thermodesulfobacteriota bacterium]